MRKLKTRAGARLGAGGKPAKALPDDRSVAVRTVIDPEELRFCQVYLAFGERDQAEAYRRSFLRKNGRGQWVDVPRGSGLPMSEINEADVITPKEASRRAGLLLRQRHIQETIAELKRSPSDHARQTLADQIRFGDERTRSKALDKILAEEDKLGMRDAAQVWAEILCDVGAEVVVPLGVVTRTLHCPECGEPSQVELDLSAEVQLDEFFPQFS